MINHGYGKLVLSIPMREQLPIYLIWRNDPQIWQWCRQATLLMQAEHEGWFAGLGKDRMFTINKPDPSGKKGMFQVIGMCGLTNINKDHGHAEFSIYINPDEQHHGYAGEALKTLVTHGFKSFAWLNCVYGETFVNNPAMKLFEKIGFKNEGTMRQRYFKDGEFIDTYNLSMLRSEWKELEKGWKVPDITLFKP